jgi:hypothetical protein
MKIPQEDNRLVLHFPDGQQGFQGIVGGGGSPFCGINQAVHGAPKHQVVFEFLCDGFHFAIDPLFLVGHQI